MAQHAILHCIEKIEQDRQSQVSIDVLYKEFCNVYYDEMDKSLRKKNVNPKAKKRLRHSLKPFWNEQLSGLWQDVCQKENSYLRASQNTVSRNILRKQFLDAQHMFNKTYKKEKRIFQQNKCDEIERLNTNDPRAFPREIQQLGPKSTSNIPMAVYNEDGSVNYRGKDVLAKWKTEFQKLYNSEAEPGTFDDAFYTYSVHEKDRLEKEYSALHSDFNADITVDEVMKVIGKAKSRKAVGLDNIPNEVLKNDVS